MFEAIKHQYEQPKSYKVRKMSKSPENQKLARTKLKVGRRSSGESLGKRVY